MNQPSAGPRKTGIFVAAVAGGIVGSLLTAAALLFALPNVLSSKIVRHGLLADPMILSEAADALRINRRVSRNARTLDQQRSHRRTQNCERHE